MEVFNSKFQNREWLNFSSTWYLQVIIVLLVFCFVLNILQLSPLSKQERNYLSLWWGFSFPCSPSAWAAFPFSQGRAEPLPASTTPLCRFEKKPFSQDTSICLKIEVKNIQIYNIYHMNGIPQGCIIHNLNIRSLWELWAGDVHLGVCMLRYDTLSNNPGCEEQARRGTLGRMFLEGEKNPDIWELYMDLRVG